jgi:hypothetical protein
VTAQLPLWGPSGAPAARAGSDTAQATRRRSEAAEGPPRGPGAAPAIDCRCVLRGIGRYPAGWCHDRDCPAFKQPPDELLERDRARRDGRPLSEGRLYQWLGPWHGLHRPERGRTTGGDDDEITVEKGSRAR